MYPARTEIMSKKAISVERNASQAAIQPGKLQKILKSLRRTSWWYLKVWFGNGLGLLLPLRPISETEPAEKVELPRLPLIWMKAVLLLRGLLRNNFILAGVAGRQARKVLAYLEAHGKPAQDLPVPVYDLRTGSREEFIERFVNANAPVVIKGLSDVEHWSIDWLLRNYGDTEVLFTDLATGRDYEAALRDITNPAEAGKIPYLHNSGRIFEQNPHLVRDLALGRLRPIEDESFAQQVFVGMKKGTGSAFHCAGIVNLFYQLEGTKRWTMVHPEHSFLLYPYLSRGNWYQTSLVGVPGPDRDYADVPLYRYCPRLTVDLEKGDVLLIPSWWYHAVDNVTERTLGVATRWRDAHQLDSNRLYNFLLFDPRTVLIVIGQMIRFAAGRGPGPQTLWEGGSHDEAAEDLLSGSGHAAWGLTQRSRQS